MRDVLRFYRLVLLVSTISILGFIGLAACGQESGDGKGGGESTGKGEPGETVTVFAAASLTDAFGELAKKFEKENPGTEVKTTFAGSSTVLAQIQQGAPADVFASADEAKMETAVQDGLVEDEPQIFVKNREVVIVPASNPADIETWRDLAKPNIKLVLAQEEVPAAEYAEEILSKADKEYGNGFKKKVLSNVVSREADVRASVNRVVVGDADATFGYASDVTPDVKSGASVIEIPENLNVTATYPIAVLKKSDDSSLARKWVDLVVSDQGQKVLKKWGFEPAV